MTRTRSIVAALAAAAFVAPAALAHPHTVSTSGQTLAHGQNHGAPSNGTMCGGDPAAYGLETAHHGPDAGTSGKADGCYQTTGSVPPGQDVESPVIR